MSLSLREERGLTSPYRDYRRLFALPNIIDCCYSDTFLTMGTVTAEFHIFSVECDTCVSSVDRGSIPGVESVVEYRMVMVRE